MTAAEGDVLTCEGLRHSFGARTALDGVGFAVAGGETYGLLGPNGAGKTTTISIVSGLLDPDGGQVTVDGRPMSTRAVDAKAAIGYVPQEIALYGNLTGRENLVFFGRLQGLRGDELRRRIDGALDVVGLAERAGERVEAYSGGMKRRCNIAAGLLHRPRLLVLDEPTVGVDPQSRNAILEAIETLSEEGLAVLYTTHYMEEAERLCHRIGIIDEGRLVAEGTRRQLIDRVGERTRLRVTASGDLPAIAVRVRTVSGVAEVIVVDDGLDVLVADGTRVLAPVLAAAEAASAQIGAVEVVEPDLEAVFLHLTGKALRD